MYVKARPTKFSLYLWLCWAIVTVGNGGEETRKYTNGNLSHLIPGKAGLGLSYVGWNVRGPGQWRLQTLNWHTAMEITSGLWRGPSLVFLMSESVHLLLSPQVLNKPMNSCDENTKELSENRFASAQNKTRSLLSHPQSQTAQVKTQFFLQVLQNCTLRMFSLSVPVFFRQTSQPRLWCLVVDPNSLHEPHSPSPSNRTCPWGRQASTFSPRLRKRP